MSAKISSTVAKKAITKTSPFLSQRDVRPSSSQMIIIREFAAFGTLLYTFLHMYLINILRSVAKIIIEISEANYKTVYM